MTRIAVFDFDKTIYKHDCLITFCLYVYKKEPLRFLILALQLLAFFKYFFTRNTQRFKEDFLVFIKNIPPDNLRMLIKEFWANEMPDNINKAIILRIDNLRKEGIEIVCITASPEIFVEPVMEWLHVDVLLGTKLKYAGNKYVINGVNCKGEEKIRRLNNYFSDKAFEVVEAYSDNTDDHNLLKLAKKGYVLEAGAIKKI